MNASKFMNEKIMSRAEFTVTLCKVAVNKGINMDLESSMIMTLKFSVCFSTEDQKEDITAFY